MMTPLEKAVEASTRFSLTYSHDGWRLYDTDVRVEGPWSGADYILANEVLSTARAKAAITAFLEAAAEDERTAERAGMAALLNGPYLHVAGEAAILALKETING